MRHAQGEDGETSFLPALPGDSVAALELRASKQGPSAGRGIFAAPPSRGERGGERALKPARPKGSQHTCMQGLQAVQAFVEGCSPAQPPKTIADQMTHSVRQRRSQAETDPVNSASVCRICTHSANTGHSP